MGKTDDLFDGSDAHLLAPPLRDRLHSYGGNTELAQDCGIAANRLDEAVALCDRAQDYLTIKLADDPLAAALAAEMREFIERVEHVCEWDKS